LALTVGAQGLMNSAKPTPLMTSPTKNPKHSNFFKYNLEDLLHLEDLNTSLAQLHGKLMELQMKVARK